MSRKIQAPTSYIILISIAFEDEKFKKSLQFLFAKKRSRIPKTANVNYIYPIFAQKAYIFAIFVYFNNRFFSHFLTIFKKVNFIYPSKKWYFGLKDQKAVCGLCNLHIF